MVGCGDHWIQASRLLGRGLWIEGGCGTILESRSFSRMSCMVDGKRYLLGHVL